VCCPACQHVSRGSFPAGVEAPVQYGPNLRALAVHLHEYQLVPLARVSELLTDLYACSVSEGTLMRWVEFAAEQLTPVVAHIADWLSAGPLQANGTGCMSTVRAGSRIWPGMPGEVGKRWKTLGSGRAFVDARCAIAGPAMITTNARRVSVARI
jgi:Transposase IS66 family